MLADDVRGLLYIALKDLRAYYFKPPNISWGILFPFAFVLAFAIRNPGDLRDLVPGLLALALLLSAAAFSSLGAFVSVAVREVFEAQTLANFIRFPMMFLGGVFVPVASLPPALQVVARALPLTYTVEALRLALQGGSLAEAALDLIVLAAFAGVLFALAVRVMARRMD